MAYEGAQILIPGLKASADLSTKQYYAVKLSGAGTVTVCAATTDIPIGILQNAPASGDAAAVCGLGVTKINSDAALAAGALIGTAADGQLAAYVAGTDTTKYIIGQVIQASGAAGGLATATVNCFSVARGA
jgi:hypothetical protein